VQQILGGPLDRLRALREAQGPYRTGPWPGLTLRGAGLLLAHAVSLGLLTELWWPLSVLPVLSVTLLMRMPAVASATCGAYLLPRAVLSLLLGWPLPPFLLAPAMVFDLIVWLRRDDLPRWRRNRWRKRVRRPRTLVPWRVAAAAAVFEGLLLLSG
jgi:hypothetical protein